MSLFAELKRRNVFRVGIAYLVVSWLLLQVGDIVFAVLNLPDFSLTLMATLLALGFIPAVVFSWAYELTPEGIKKESEIDRSTSVTHHTARKLDLITIALVVVGIGFLIFDRFVLSDFDRTSVGFEGVTADVVSETGSDPGLESALTPSEPYGTDSAPPPKSIAVLPFLNISSDREQEYFSDGLSETLLHMLAQVDGLRVAARTSSFQFKGRTTDLVAIGRQLKVSHVLEGSVQRSGNTVRVTAQLNQVDDGFNLWSGNYDRKLENIFAIQDDIAKAVVDALKLTLLGDPATVLAKDSTDNLPAYEEYLRGRQQLVHFSYQSLPAAEAHFKRAIALDPDYLLAHIALAESYILMGNTGMIPITEYPARIGPLADRVLQLDPESASGQVLRGYVELPAKGPAGVETRFRRAYELEPENDFVAIHYSTMLRWSDQPERSAEVAKKALARDPMSPLFHLDLARVYNDMERSEKALFHARQVQSLDPESPNGYGEMAEALQNCGRFVEAVQALAKAAEIDPIDYEFPVDQAMNYLAIGALDPAAALITRALEMEPRGILPIAGRAALEYRRGDYQAAGLRALEAIAADIEPRRWGRFLVARMIREHALRSGNPGAYLDHVPGWAQVDLGQARIDNNLEFELKLLSVPVLRAANSEQQAAAIIEAGAAHLRERRDEHPDPYLAIARRDPDATIEAIRWSLRNGIFRDWWMHLDSVTLDFVSDDPRFLAIVAEIETEVAAQRALLDEDWSARLTPES